MSIQRNISDTKNKSLANNFSLYLKVHVMPTLNKPLKGKAWHWITPLALVGILIIVFVYYFGN